MPSSVVCAASRYFISVIADPYVLAATNENEISGTLVEVLSRVSIVRMRFEVEMRTHFHEKRTDISDMQDLKHKCAEVLERLLPKLRKRLFHPRPPPNYAEEHLDVVLLRCDEDGRGDVVECEEGQGDVCSRWQHYPEVSKIAARILRDIDERVMKGPVLLVLPELCRKFKLRLNLEKARNICREEYRKCVGDEEVCFRVLLCIKS